MAKDQFDRKWIIENALEEIQEYAKGELTIRGLHYRLVSRGMTNSMQHYKRVVSAMIKARWDSLIDFDTFSDHDREMIGTTDYEKTSVIDEIENAKEQIEAWMNSYWKNKWENQPNYVEVFIEKKALQGVFQSVCRDNDIALGACKGYPSLTFLHEAYLRFFKACSKGKKPIILYFGDYDPSGEDIPRSIKQNLWDFGVSVDVRRISLLKSQVIEWELPPAPAKRGDSRTANWDGLGQVELDAVSPKKLQSMCKEAISSVFNQSLYNDLISTQKEEREYYQAQLKLHVKTL